MTDKNPLAHYSGVLSEAVQESAAEQIPVSGQSRFHGQKWAECSVEHVAMVLSAPHEWEGYEVRYLYAAPVQAAVDTPVAAMASPTFMTADQACKWAWSDVRDDVGTEGWTAGDSCNFYGFFLHGWNYRGQYELQRTAAVAALKQELTAAPVAVAVPDAEYGATEFGWTFAGIQLEEGDKRLMAMLVNALGSDHPAIDDLDSLIRRSRLGRAALAATPAATPTLISSLKSILADADVGPPTDSEWCCKECGKWTPWHHPEAHDHEDGCTALRDYAKRRDWKSRLSALISIAQAAPAASEQDAPITWPKARDVGRFGDMSPTAFLRVGLDSDNDVYASINDGRCGADIEFCMPGAGGGKSSRTRLAMLALMVAMEADNADDPGRDWWGLRGDAAAQAAQQGEKQ